MNMTVDIVISGVTVLITDALTLELSEDSRADILRGFGQLVSTSYDALRAVAAKEHDIARLTGQLKDTAAELVKAAEVKKDSDAMLRAKFVAVLNAKKAEIERLRLEMDRLQTDLESERKLRKQMAAEARARGNGGGKAKAKAGAGAGGDADDDDDDVEEVLSSDGDDIYAGQDAALSGAEEPATGACALTAWCSCSPR